MSDTKYDGREDIENAKRTHDRLRLLFGLGRLRGVLRKGFRFWPFWPVLPNPKTETPFPRQLTLSSIKKERAKQERQSLRTASLHSLERYCALPYSLSGIGEPSGNVGEVFW